MVVLLVTEDDQPVPPALWPIRSHLAKVGSELRCIGSRGPNSVMPDLLKFDGDRASLSDARLSNSTSLFTAHEIFGSVGAFYS